MVGGRKEIEEHQCFERWARRAVVSFFFLLLSVERKCNLASESQLLLSSVRAGEVGAADFDCESSLHLPN